MHPRRPSPLPAPSPRTLRAAAVAAAIAWPLAAFGQLPVTNYSYSVSPSGSYPDSTGTELTNGSTAVSTFPGPASSNLVGWINTNPNIQFNFTGGQSVSTARVWVAPTSAGVGVYQPVTLTVSAGAFSRTLTLPALTNNSLTVAVDITGISAAADQFTVTSTRGGEWTMFSQVQFFGTGAKANNTSSLNLASSWTGNQAPVSTDVVLFNNTFTGTTALDTGAAVNWSGMRVTGGSGTLTIDPASAANRLGIGSSGIELANATRNVRITDLRLTGATAQPWSIASGRSLTVGADSLAQDSGANPTLSGAGTLVKEGASTGLTLGSLTSFTGTLNVQAGSLTTSAANQLSNNYTVNLAAGSTLQLGGNDTLPTSLNSGAGTIEILSSNALTITNATARTVDRVFAGTGSLTKTGAGILTLTGANTHSGGVLISGGSGVNGTLRLGSNTALGSGTVTIGGANLNQGSTLDLNGTTITNPIVIQALGSGVADTGALQNTNTSTAAVVNAPVQIGGTNYVGGDGNITFNGVVSGGVNNSYSLYKQGVGTWTFANLSNTFDGFYYQIGGVTEVTRLANAGEASSLGQVSAGQNLFVFGFNNSGGGTLRYIGSAASTSDRAFSLRGATSAASNTIEAAGASDAATLTLTGSLSAGANAAYTARLAGANAGVNVYAGSIANGSGAVALEKDGATTWALTGANTYSGATTVTAGTLKVGNGGATGTLGGGGVSVATGATLAFDRSDAGLVVSNIISGSGAVVQIGSGTTSLTGANTYTSPTQIAAGMLRIGNGSTAGTLGSGSVAIAAGAALAFNRSDSVTVSNAIGGAGSVVKQGGNTLTLSGSNAYSGGTRLTAGTLIVGSDQALGTGTLSFATAGATLQTSRNVTVPIAVDADGTLAIVGSGVDLTANFSGNATLSKTGTGTLTLSGPASTFSGNLVIAGGAGANSIVRAGNTAAFGTGTVTINGGGSNTGSTFDLNGNSLDNSLVIGLGNSGVNDAGALMNSNAAVPSVLNGGVSLGGEIYVGGPGSITFNGVVSGGVNPANPYALYKDGGGTWTFANPANTFDGFYYQVGGVTEVTRLANLNQVSSLGQPTTADRNRVLFGFNGSGGGTIRFIGTAASTSDRAFVLAGGTAAASNVIEASGGSAAATLTLTGNLSASRSGAYAATLGGANAGVNVYAGTIGNGLATSLGLVKEGSTTWALTAANTYTGATTIAAGTLQIGNGGTTGELGGTGSVTNDGVLAVNRSNAFSFARAITGSGAFHQLGSGTTTLAGSNTYSGGTVVSAGRLVGTAASLQGAITNNAAVEFAQTTSGTFAGSIDGSGALTKSGAGSLTISGSNGFTGDTALTAGTLVLANANALGASSVVTMQPGTTLTLNQRTYVGDVDQFGGTIDGTGELVTTLFRTSSGTIAAPIADADGGIARGIRKISSGTTTVTTANTFTGAARVEAGTLALGSGGSFAAGSSAELFAGATLDLAGQSQTFAGVSGAGGTIALGAGTLTVNAAVANTFGGVITGSGGLTKQGGGDFVLSGTSTYTGATSVAGGRLSVNGSLGNTPVAVLAAAELGGSGIIGGPVSIASGGTLAPGNSIASLAAGATSFASGATFDYEVDSSNLGALGTAADLLVVSGNLDIAAGSLLSFTDIAGVSAQPFVEDTTVFAMINYSGTWDGGVFTYNGTPLTDGSRFFVGSQLWEIDYNRTSVAGLANFTGDYLPSSSFVAITAVPEPSTLVLVAAAAGLAVMARRRK